MSGGDLSGIERGSLGSRGSLPSCSTATRVHGGAIGSANQGATWPLPSTCAPISQLWFGCQVHSTRVLVWSQLVLAVIAAVLLMSIARGTLDPSRLDWVVDQPKDSIDYDDSPTMVNDSTESDRVEIPNTDSPARSRRSIISDWNEVKRRREWGTIMAGVAYFYLGSIFFAWWGVQAAEARGMREEATDGECRTTANARDGSRCGGWLSRWVSGASVRRATTTLLLVPWLLSVLSLFVPLLLMTIYLISQPCYYITRREMDSLTYWGYEIWFKYIPLMVVWIISLYFFFGCAMAFVFTWRRSDGRFGGTVYGTYNGLRRGPPPRGVPLRESAAAASFSWTFRSTKDRYRITNKDGDLNKSTYSMASNRSYKSTRNPTLRGYTRKTDDMDVSLMSEENYAAGDSLERNYNNNCYGGQGYNSSSSLAPAGPYICTLTTISNTSPSRRMSSSEQMRASRGFAAYSGAGVSRSPLEPVEEEEYTPTPEKTAENADLRM
ncbi:hypothetical protein PENTCL1PPCAC_23185 [Pristionchus entomophagus]|uniref:Uncharacterized protein n=1 Tax=Pristionchus entomophagus TaxID=358040 RepID=A0AAV5U3E8_9BILA|nr:hypothetical protein PENTCL1PPCAC_23185 [Pristionchus entomophagus]